MDSAISRVFMNGNSQAVRIPQEFRLEASRVRISRNEAGDLVIHPLAADRGAALLQSLRAFDEPLTADWVARLEADRRQQPLAQEREPL
jgi:antitoxin VapB